MCTPAALTVVLSPEATAAEASNSCVAVAAERLLRELPRELSVPLLAALERGRDQG
jgi:hypothetical protein